MFEKNIFNRISLTLYKLCMSKYTSSILKNPCHCVFYRHERVDWVFDVIVIEHNMY